MRLFPMPPRSDACVGKWGLLQVPCDVIKMLTKEIIDLKFSDRLLYNLAPFMVIIASFLTYACLPVSKGPGSSGL